MSGAIRRIESPQTLSASQVSFETPAGTHAMDADNISLQPSSNSGFQDTPPRSDIDEILRRKRKAREYKVRASLARMGREREGRVQEVGLKKRM